MRAKLEWQSDTDDTTTAPQAALAHAPVIPR